MKQSSLQKRVSNITPKKFHEIDLFGVNFLTPFCKLERFTFRTLFLSELWKDLAYKRDQDDYPKKLYELDHGHTLAYRTSLGLSLQL